MMSVQTATQLLVTEEQITKFNEAGYLVVENAIPQALVTQLLAAIDRVKEQLAHSEQRKDIFGLDIRPIIDKDDTFLELLEWPTTFPLAVRFLNHFNIQLMTSHLIMVPPNPEQRNIGWHDDGGTPVIGVNGIRAFGSLKIGYFLTDLLAPNMGALMVVPGSHRLQGRPVFAEGARDPVGAVELKVKAGDAVIFQQGLYHAGAPNYSEQTRVVLYYGYNFRVSRPIDYDTMPQELLEKCSPIGKQLLGERATHLGYYIPTDADCPLKAWFAEHFGETWSKGRGFYQ
ncbi:MAG TPA: phytanoyl-CoA dioxygenase family protein [Caldilineaceae bacterium]|nr:phytanoyl-CoA dioxygenase family protein [Caldilineaceae bacterium]